jgi:hypothetical protein
MARNDEIHASEHAGLNTFYGDVRGEILRIGRREGEIFFFGKSEMAQVKLVFGVSPSP